ncbi:MAG: cytochrome c [Marinifilaceae bacterium]
MKRLNLFFAIIGFLLFSCSERSGKKEKEAVSYAPLTKMEREAGSSLYRSKCMNCHLANGQGIQGVYPPLADSDFLRNNVTKSLRMVKFGANIPIKVNGQKYHNLMPASGLQDEDLVTVFNYVLNSWGNQYGRISLKDVKELKP